MKTVHINEAETSFSALLASVEAGEEVAITRYGRVVAHLLPGARRAAGVASHPRWGEARMALEASAGVETGLLAPLD